MGMPAKILCTFLLAVSASTAFASLGGEPERFGKQSTTDVTYQAGYSLRTTTLASGTVVKEYVSDSGVVFAVAWKGPFKPNLRKLLGAHHFRTLVRDAKRKGHASRSRLQTEEADVVVQARGHMRAYEGKAWMPSQLPAGVSTDDIR